MHFPGPQLQKVSFSSPEIKKIIFLTATPSDCDPGGFCAKFEEH